jgi:hypothetical protein
MHFAPTERRRELVYSFPLVPAFLPVLFTMLIVPYPTTFWSAPIVAP